MQVDGFANAQVFLCTICGTNLDFRVYPLLHGCLDWVRGCQFDMDLVSSTGWIFRKLLVLKSQNNRSCVLILTLRRRQSAGMKLCHTKLADDIFAQGPLKGFSNIHADLRDRIDLHCHPMRSDNPHSRI